LSDFDRGQVPQAGILDLDVHADILWPLFQCDVSEALGVELWQVTKDERLVHDLGVE
jgi:hypothetical protein